TDFLSPFFASSSHLNRVRTHITKRVLPFATSIRVVSNRIKDALLQHKGYKLKTTPVVLPIFTDMKKIQTTDPSFDLKVKYPQWSFIILVVARLSPEKNVTDALAVLKVLLKKYTKMGMVIVGSGPLRKSLKFKVKSLKLEDNVVFKGQQEDTISYYKTAHLFLQTSLYEGFGLALLEAVTARCPSVSTDVGIASEFLQYPNQQFVCPVGDVLCLAGAISRFVENNQLRQLFSLDIAPTIVEPFYQTKESYLNAYRASFEEGGM
ncbi:MAG: glycosyltransferase, partial [Candidatus Taylorbacteria bacterium]|nr:glycosyltransferase [Candidatus Taylorbacteria bacterium]